MKYRNTKTGYILETNSAIKGNDWEVVAEKATPSKNPEKKAAVKKEPAKKNVKKEK